MKLMEYRRLFACSILLALVAGRSASAATYPLPAESDSVIGEIQYVVTRYEPPCAIEYLVLSDPALVDALALTLEAAPAPAPGGVTALTWRRTFTALAAEGEARVAERAAAFEARVPHLAELLERYLPNAAGEAKRTFAT